MTTSAPAAEYGYEAAAPFYDLFERKNNLDFFGEYAALGAEALDIGAGTGRLAIPLAQRGLRLTCVEPCAPMRAEFERKLLADPDAAARITLVDGDAASFSLERAFPVALMAGVFEHLLTPEARLAALTNIARHLEPGGLLVFDIFLAALADEPLTPAGRVSRDGREYRRYLATRQLGPNLGETLLRYEVYQDGQRLQRVEQRQRVALTSLEEIENLLAQAGLAVRLTFRDYQFTPYMPGDSLLVVDAVRVR